jgi:prepilin-type processing-associated H-X9-DG protein
MRHAPSTTRHALSRLEAAALAVLALIAVGVLLTLLRSSWDQSDRVVCMNQLKRLGEAIFEYHEQHKHLPASCIADGYATWPVQLAPYLFKEGENDLLGWDMAETYYRQPGDVRRAQFRLLYCPARRHAPLLSTAGDVHAGKLYPGALGDYACSSGSGAAAWDTAKATGAIIVGDVLRRDGERIVKWTGRTSLNDRSLERGLQYTILLGEKHVPLDEWGRVEVGDGSIYNGDHYGSFARIGGVGHPIAPSMAAAYDRNFGSYHPGLCQFLYADGNVHAHSTAMDATVLGDRTNRFKEKD